MASLSIVIPHRGNLFGLWATIHACEAELERTEHTYEYVIVSNGDPIDDDLNTVLGELNRTGRLQHVHFDEALTPPVARQRGAEAAKHDLLCFFDNHCIPGRQYFDRAALDMEKLGPDAILHSTTVFHSGQGKHYEYALRLNYNFWGQSKQMPYRAFKPYKIGAGGHGGFVATKSLWMDIGGYGPDSLFHGYGGEELSFDLRAWRWGKQVFIDPLLLHFHYPGSRGYVRHYSDDYYTNMMVSAFVVGGEPWLWKTANSFITGNHMRCNPQAEMYDLVKVAWERGHEYSREVDRRSIISFDDLRVWFRTNEVMT